MNPISLNVKASAGFHDRKHDGSGLARCGGDTWTRIGHYKVRSELADPFFFSTQIKFICMALSPPRKLIIRTRNTLHRLFPGSVNFPQSASFCARTLYWKRIPTGSLDLSLEHGRHLILFNPDSSINHHFSFDKRAFSRVCASFSFTPSPLPFLTLLQLVEH